MISLQVSLDEDENDLMRAGEGEQRGGRVRQRCRHRHFSLEDYQGHESEDSNLSSLSMGLSNCDNSGTAATEVEEGAAAVDADDEWLVRKREGVVRYVPELIL